MSWQRDYPPPQELPYEDYDFLIPVLLRAPLKSNDHNSLIKLYPVKSTTYDPTEPQETSSDLELGCVVFQCTLTDLLPAGRSKFTALSYVWGKPQATHMITGGCKTAYITANLHLALTYIGFADRERLIWVDSLCINQADPQEKSAQVQRMHLIFSQAHCVVWLGLENEPGLFNSLSLIIHKLASMSPDASQQLSEACRYIVDTYEMSPCAGYPGLDSLPWTRLNTALFLVYFRRLWVAQEVILASSFEAH
jgi:hypothetical protein